MDTGNNPGKRRISGGRARSQAGLSRAKRKRSKSDENMANENVDTDITPLEPDEPETRTTN